jgi:uncharacterized membrane protein
MRGEYSVVAEHPNRHHFRFHKEHEHLAAPFGSDSFGKAAEHVARFFGTPKYILTQTGIVIIWLVFNGFEIFVHFDKYPFILLNLAFSTQAAYAAPLILLAATRQAERDKAHADADAKHREALAQEAIKRQQAAEEAIGLLKTLLEQNTTLTQQVNRLTQEIHAKVAS